ncbi:hypothetical protein [Calothrix sp. PCC 6303]|uniref:hypothetical protein n=1 Tax=Calothrix sp. PCC 6303 TaxID=1170562 RepID=UPI0002A043D2|nr:hypothetical protein [Calothrix sp. PCC 6303]AFZ01563.1 hypothetical protein Cal6303_2582 [Calothrix sp. PCC 6303]
MYEAFIDLDELIVRCRDKQAKKFIQEAVACYKVGAYRSCIVAIWNAVVFDFLHKLRELELLGDKEASQLLEHFEKLSSEKKVKELWQFESDIPKKALKPFELISIVEMSDIERLFEDRSRCAHPSMTSLEEPFEATAELARYHLRSAVTHLLERPPVQGRAARDRVFQDIKSEYFPTVPELAIKYFQKSPLARARLALIKDVILGLTISLLTENLPEDERARQFSAIHAISSMYPEQTREILNEKLSDIIINKVQDNHWDNVIIYLGHIKTWDTLTELCQLKAVAFIEKLNIFDASRYGSLSEKNAEVFLEAFHIAFLKEAISIKLQSLTLNKLLSFNEFSEKKLQENLVSKIIQPILEKAIPKASFDNLIAMKSKNNNSLNDKINLYLAETIKEAFLEELLEELSQITQEEKLLKITEQRLLYLLENASLEKLFEVRESYLCSLSCRNLEKVIEMLNTCVVRLCKKSGFDELILMKSKYSDDLLEELIQPILKENIPQIVSKFRSSSSYNNAESNASILSEIADSLSDTQWESILKGFCDNDQIYHSFACNNIFKHLFKKSIELSGSIQPYWLPFRKNLDKFGNKEINGLKQVIDYYLLVE